jgi:glyoxylate reductase
MADQPAKSRFRIFVTRPIVDGPFSQLNNCDLEVWNGDAPPTYEQLSEKVRGVDGLICTITDNIDDKLMNAAGPQLKVISNYGVGFNHIDVAAATKHGIKVGNTPDALTEATADIAAGLILMCARRLMESSLSIPKGEWKTWEPLGFLGHDLAGKTLGIVGMGRIGYALARRFARGWDMKVVYTSRSDKPDADRDLGAKRVSLDELLAVSDVVSVHTNLSAETKYLFDKSAFAKMKPNSIFINTARGSVHNQKDLYDALKNNVIASAGLDVTDPEPIPLDDPLLTLSNCVILPHIGSATFETRTRMTQIVVDNLKAGLAGQTLPCAVN